MFKLVAVLSSCLTRTCSRPWHAYLPKF